MDIADPGRMPALYLGHDAPPLADDPVWTWELAAWAGNLPEPRAILMISAHWEEAPLAIGASSTVPLVYDFWGFPERYYTVEYPAPGAPELAAQVRALLRGPQLPVQNHPERGLDHGAYVPLKEMYPDARVPVLQISMPTLHPEGLMRVGRALAPLRDEGVLIVGSGFFTHNLQAMGAPDIPGWSIEFDDWGRRALGERNRRSPRLPAQGAGERARTSPNGTLRTAVRHARCGRRRAVQPTDRHRRLLARIGETIRAVRLTAEEMTEQPKEKPCRSHRRRSVT